MFDKILDFVIASVRAEEKAKYDKQLEAYAVDLSFARPAGQFWASTNAGSLVGPCADKAAHHRERELYWTGKLEEAEKELREKGISMEVFDQQSQTFLNIVSSGAVAGHVQNFQPRVDQRLMDNVKNCKAKMLEHREKAKGYEQYARAFVMNPQFTIKLTVQDVTYFGLGE